MLVNFSKHQKAVSRSLKARQNKGYGRRAV